MEIRLLVMGRPQPAGSKKGFQRGVKTVVVDANNKAKPWKKLVAAEARVRYGGTPLTGPVEVEMTFFLKRPKYHYGTGRNAEVLKASAAEYPLGPPDALKLARGVEDALTGIIYKDDAQIVNETLRKRYGTPERCEVIIRRV